MRTPILLFAGALALGASPLKTDYRAERAVRVTITSTGRLATTLNEIERDGEKQPGLGSASSVTERKEVHVDRWLAVDEGQPIKLRRRFIEIGGETSAEMGERSETRAIESTFEGVTLELERKEDGEVEARVVDGSEPAGDAALEGHSLTLMLDPLLPQGEVEEGATWELESKDVLRALHLDLQAKLYARPEPTEEEGQGRRRRPSGPSILEVSEWEGEAKLADLEADKDGVRCALIELRCETEGEDTAEIPDRQRGGAFALPSERTQIWSVKLEGKLWYDLERHRPIALELSGATRQEMILVRTRENGGTFRSHSVNEGTLDYTVTIEDEPFEADEGEKAKDGEKKKD